MELEHLEQAIAECTEGNLAFNNGKNLQCFLYENTWYPMMAVVKRALEIANVPDPNLNSRDALFRLFNVLHYVRYQNQNVQGHQLIDLTPQEKLDEVEYLSHILAQITN